MHYNRYTDVCRIKERKYTKIIIKKKSKQNRFRSKIVFFIVVVVCFINEKHKNAIFLKYLFNVKAPEECYVKFNDCSAVLD